MILIIGAFHGEGGIGTLALAKIALSIVFLGLMIAYLGQRKRVRLPFVKEVGRANDLTPLAGLGFCFGAAALSGLARDSGCWASAEGTAVAAGVEERRERVVPVAADPEPLQLLALHIHPMLRIGAAFRAEFLDRADFVRSPGQDSKEPGEL